jgi:hypothetical protein
MKYSYEEMKQLHDKYYDDQGFVRHTNLVPLKKIDGLYYKWSDITDKIKTENKHVFDILEIAGTDCIRFNITKHSDCGCRYTLFDEDDIDRLTDFLIEYRKERESRN